MRIRFASIIVTYRCNARCQMCDTWQYPTRPGEEAGVQVYEKLPYMGSVNVTGGEPFLREDLSDIVSVLKKKTGRLVISSNGSLTDRTLRLFEKHRDIGIRISLEGLPMANDRLRGIRDGFDKGIRTLVELCHMGVKDIGFGITVSDSNSGDLLELYHLARIMGVEFATAAVHNSFYFHKHDNSFEHPEAAAEQFRKLSAELLKSGRVKDWFRAYFNHGLANYIRGNPRLLPCSMGYDSFFLDPAGIVLPCNVMDSPMGDLAREPFEEIWNGAGAGAVRALVKACDKNCWMVGNAAQPMKRHILTPLKWIAKKKLFMHGALS